MANSSIIESAKNKIIKEFIKDENIAKAINSSTVTSAEKLIGTHIFDYHQNPNTINTVETFITIQVHIPESFYRNDSSNVFVTDSSVSVSTTSFVCSGSTILYSSFNT